MIDNERATVDIRYQKLNEIFQDMENIYNNFKTSANCVLIIPIDYCLLYNVSDYIILILIFDLKSRYFDLLHLWEMKRLSTTTTKTEKQIKREERQKMRMNKVLSDYNTQADLHDFFQVRSYLQSRKPEIDQLIINSGELVIDSVFSLLVTNQKPKSNPDYWFSNIFEEITCGAIIPSVFRGVHIDLFKDLIKNNELLYIKVDKNIFKQEIGTLKKLKKIVMHDSIYHGYIIIEEGTISLANLFHYKFSIDDLKLIFDGELIKQNNMLYSFGIANHIFMTR